MEISILESYLCTNICGDNLFLLTAEYISGLSVSQHNSWSHKN